MKNTRIHDAYRILDANLNRTKEGLRVCEDICRFYLNDQKQSQALSRMRHRLTTIFAGADISPLELFRHRDTRRDIGKAFACGPKRTSFKGVFLANAQRAKEALRVLEEFLKIFDESASKKVQKLRFDFYGVEKKIVQRFPALLDPR